MYVNLCTGNLEEVNRIFELVDFENLDKVIALGRANYESMPCGTCGAPCNSQHHKDVCTTMVWVGPTREP